MRGLSTRWGGRLVSAATLIVNSWPAGAGPELVIPPSGEWGGKEGCGGDSPRGPCAGPGEAQPRGLNIACAFRESSCI